MKAVNLIVISFLMVMSSCNAQDKNNSKELTLTEPSVKMTDPRTKPDICYKVNKQYDDKGNIIRYDSTYSYSYSGAKGANLDLQKDSVFSNFKSHFGNSSLSLFDSPGAGFFPKDSTFVSPFDDKYFEKQMEMNQKMMQQFFQHFNAVPFPENRKRQNEQTRQKSI